MSPTELTMFPSFSRLPTEIRIMIWKLAIRATPGRHIVLRYTPPLLSRQSHPLNEWPDHVYTLTVPLSQQLHEITSHAQIPAVLHACHLSRQLSKERWEPSLGGYAAAEKKVYVDVRTDAIYFPDGTILSVWRHVGDWADVLKFVDGRVFVVRKGDLENSTVNTARAIFEYRSQELKVTITSGRSWSVLYRRNTD